MIHVCVVDDDPMLLAGMKRVLRRSTAELNVTLCTTGAEVQAALLTQPVDVLISDLRMPAMDGQTLMAIVKAQFPHVARVIMTGDLDPQQSFALQLVAHRAVAKPADAHTMLSMVQSLGESIEPSGAPIRVNWARAAARRLGEQGVRSISGEVARGNPWLTMLLLQATNGGFVSAEKPVGIEAAMRALGPVHLTIMSERLQALALEESGSAGAEETTLTHDLGTVLALAREHARQLAPRYVGQSGDTDLSVADFVAMVECAVLLRTAAPVAGLDEREERDLVLHVARDAARMGVPMRVVAAVRESVNQEPGDSPGAGALVKSVLERCSHGSVL